MGKDQMEEAKALWSKLRSGELTKEEEVLLLRWLNQYQSRPNSEIADETLELATQALKDRLEGSLRVQMTPRRDNVRHFRVWAAAAAVLLLLGTVVAISLSNLEGRTEFDSSMAYDFNPGQNKAVLVLENGEEVPLGELNQNEIQVGSFQVKQTADSGLVYVMANRFAGSVPLEKPSLNSVYTPRGGEYKLHLPDGSIVWLNSESRVTYAIPFGDTREIELEGEAYFQVAKDAQRPFIVHTALQKIDVLGTEFNVKAYPGATANETALVSGKLRASVLASPDQQVVLNPGESVLVNDRKELQKGRVNLTKIIAWKNGDFYFEDESLPEIMETLARWYDVDIKFANEMGDKGRFGGVISRDKKLSAVLAMLESTGKIKFEITEKEVVLMN